MEILPKGLIYLPHERIRSRLNEAFGPGFWRLVALGNPIEKDGEILWRWRLETRDGYSAESIGHAKFIPNNKDYSYGDALESAKSDALVRLAKDIGLGLQCWNREYQIRFMQTYGYRYQSTKDHKWYWRRKDRPAPADEKQSERQQGPDYVPRETLDHANRQHFDSLNPSPAARRFDQQLTPVSKEDHYYDPDDDEQLRRLHELEEAVFSDDGRE